MPKTIVVETRDEFVERHGGEPVELNGELLLPDGARIVPADNNAKHEPPGDPYRRIRLQTFYWTRRVEIATNDFSEAQSAFRQQAKWAKAYPSSCLPPPPNAKEILRKLKGKVEHARQELAKVEKKFDATPQQQAKRRNRQLEAERQQRIDSQLGEIDSVQI